MSNELAATGGATQQVTLRDRIAYAKELAHGSLVPQAYREQPANILLAMDFGASMGLTPAESLYRISVIQGKPTAGAELIASNVRKAGHRLRVEKDEGRMSATATIYRADDPEFPFSVTRDMEWAKGMGLASKDNYKRQPLTMLTWRAITACAREACPEALYGVAYTPDEMFDFAPEAPRAEPVSVAAEVERVEGPDLSRLRSMMPEFAAVAAPGVEPRAEQMRFATGLVLDYMGAESMGDLDRDGVERAEAYMAEVIASYETEDE